MVTFEQFEQGRFHRVAQAIGSLGDAIGKVWLTIIGTVAALAIAAVATFMWNANGDIHDLKTDMATVKQGVSGLPQLKEDVHDMQRDIHDMRDNGVKRAPSPQ